MCSPCLPSGSAAVPLLFPFEAPPFPGYMRPWEGRGHGQGEVGKDLSWNERNKSSCSGQVIASGEAWRGRARAGEEGCNEAMAGCGANTAPGSPLPVGPGRSWAWARAWPGLRGRTGGPVTLCLQTREEHGLTPSTLVLPALARELGLVISGAACLRPELVQLTQPCRRRTRREWTFGLPVTVPVTASLREELSPSVAGTLRWPSPLLSSLLFRCF